MGWKAIYKLSSLPYNQGEEFYARYNSCFCETNDPYIKNCLKTRPCIVRFVVLNDLSFFKFDTAEKRNKMSYGKQALISNFKYWKLIKPDIGTREDIFVCTCQDSSIVSADLKSSKEVLECCHCYRLMMRCSEHCINASRGK